MATDTARDMVLELGTAHVAARVLHVVCDLGVADALDSNPRSADELAADVGADAGALSRLLRLLEMRGLFTRDDAGRWQHTEASRWLRADHPASLRGYARMSGLPFN